MHTARDYPSAFPQSISFMHYACINSSLVYALVSYTPHAFTLVLLELVASAMHFSSKQQLLINARMNQHAFR